MYGNTGPFLDYIQRIVEDILRYVCVLLHINEATSKLVMETLVVMFGTVALLVRMYLFEFIQTKPMVCMPLSIINLIASISITATNTINYQDKTNLGNIIHVMITSKIEEQIKLARYYLTQKGLENIK